MAAMAPMPLPLASTFPVRGAAPAINPPPISLAPARAPPLVGGGPAGSLGDWLMQSVSTPAETARLDLERANYVQRQTQTVFNTPLQADMDRRRKIIFLAKMSLRLPEGLQTPIQPNQTIVDLTSNITSFRDADTGFFLFERPSAGADPTGYQWPVHIAQDPEDAAGMWPLQVNPTVSFIPDPENDDVYQLQHANVLATEVFPGEGEPLTVVVGPGEGYYGDVVRSQNLIAQEAAQRENRNRNYRRYLMATNRLAARYQSPWLTEFDDDLGRRG